MGHQGQELLLKWPALKWSPSSYRLVPRLFVSYTHWFLPLDMILHPRVRQPWKVSFCTSSQSSHPSQTYNWLTDFRYWARAGSWLSPHPLWHPWQVLHLGDSSGKSKSCWPLTPPCLEAWPAPPSHLHHFLPTVKFRTSIFISRFVYKCVFKMCFKIVLRLDVRALLCVALFSMNPQLHLK